MSRVIKRVPLDFNAPLEQTWEGYKNPYYCECPRCIHGYSNLFNYINYKSIYKLFEERVKHIKIPVEKKEAVETIISKLLEMENKEEVPDCAGETTFLIRDLGFEHGLGDDWYTCDYCNGFNIHPEVLDAYNAWKHYDPPVGEAYQLWVNDVPITPPFETLEELAEYCEKKKVSIFADITLTKEQWMEQFSKEVISYEVPFVNGRMIFI